MHVQRQVEYELRYKGYRIGRFFADVLVEEKLLLEIKAERKLLPIDEAQVITYLRVTDLSLGMLVNFGGRELEIKRIPNFVSQRSARSPEIADPPSSQLLYPALTHELRALLYDTHSTLGPGFMHMHYRRATQIELRRLRQYLKLLDLKLGLIANFHAPSLEMETVRIQSMSVS